MKKNYALLYLLFAVFGLLGGAAYAQPTLSANDDYAAIPNGSATVVVIPNVLANDTDGGLPITLADVSFAQIYSSNNALNIDNNGAVIYSNGPIPNGVYELNYTICTTTPPFYCDDAIVHVNIGCTPPAAPVVSSVVQPTCSAPNGSITLSNLPLSPWTLIYVMDGGPWQTTTGSGTTTTISVPGNIGNHYYQIFLNNGGICYSPSVYVIINPVVGTDVTMTGTYVDYNADGFTDVGDVINYQYTIYNYNCTALTDVSLTGPPGLTITGNSIPSIPGAGSDSTTFTGTYVVTQNDINAGTVQSYAIATATFNGTPLTTTGQSSTSLNITDGIRLVAFLDANGNGIKDVNESYFYNGTYTYEINTNGAVHHIGSYGPIYLYESSPTTTYAISYAVNNDIASHYSVSPSSYTNVTVPVGSGVTTYYFPITAIPYSDASVYLWGSPVRPGFTTTYTIYYGNNGNQTIPSGTIDFVKSSALSILSISQSGTVATSSGFSYSFTNLLPFESRYIYVTMQVPTIPTVSLGQTLVTDVSISGAVTDVNFYNNFSDVIQTVVGSYDPNEKTESHGSQIVHSTFGANDFLTYTIRFENTGTANAINIKVADVLDPKLDETTVKMISASHGYVLDRIGSNLTWRFDGIDLPPSLPNDAVTGHGYVVFQVKPKSGFALGDIIPNTANIFFDFNPAIVTNTCTTAFVPFLGVNDFDKASIQYYPNPTAGIITFAMKDKSTPIDAIEVMDVLGKTLVSKATTYSEVSIDLSTLSKGMYLVRVKANGREKIVKISKN